MKKVIGSEISARSHPEPAPKPELETQADAAPRMPHSRHMLDLRDVDPAAASAPAATTEDDVEAVGDLVIRDRVAEDVARMGMHQEEEPEEGVEPQGSPSEPAAAGQDTGHTEEKDSVRPREGGAPPGTKRKGLLGRLFKGPKFSRRKLLVWAVQLAIVLMGTVMFLSLDIPLPERLIGIYFIASIVYDIDSQRTFIVALIFLVMVAVTSALGQSVPAASHAVYAFYFLVIGLLAAIREQITNRSKTVGGNSQLSD